MLWNDLEGLSVEKCDGHESCKYFQIIFFRLPQEACIELATQDWRSSAMGLHQMYVMHYEVLDLPGEHVTCVDSPSGRIAGDDSIEACPNGTTVPIPVPLDLAVDACNCPSNDCEIVWWFK